MPSFVLLVILHPNKIGMKNLGPDLSGLRACPACPEQSRREQVEGVTWVTFRARLRVQKGVLTKRKMLTRRKTGAHRLYFLVFGILCIIAGLSCGGSGAAVATPPVPPPPTVDLSKYGKNVVGMYDNRLEPAVITIKVGESVTWVNAGSVPHGARSGRGPNKFYTGTLLPGQSFISPDGTFAEPGETEYGGFKQPDNKGKVVVVP